MNPAADTTVIVNWRDLSHPQAGGAEMYCEEVASRLARNGRRVVLLTSAVAGQPASETRDGYLVVRRGGPFSVYAFSFLWILRHRRRIGEVVDSQCGIPCFAPLAVRRGTPVVALIYHVHQEQFGQYLSPLLAQIGRWIEGPISRLVYGRRTIVTISPTSRRDIRRTLGLKGTIQVAIPGCRTVVSEPGDLSGRSPTPRVVFVGRLMRHKRPHLAVEAFPAVVDRFPDAELHIVGDGPERPMLEDLVRLHGLQDRVIFHGLVPAAERDSLVRSAWVTVTPSLAEGWGIVVIEANALGRPAVALRVPGLSDSIRDDQTGWLVEEGGPLGRRLADSLALLESDEMAARWSSQTVQWASRCNWDDTADMIDNALRAEKGRLHQDNRRDPTDLTSHVFVPTTLASVHWKPTFRVTDRSLRNDEGVYILLIGADLDDAVTALRRSGLHPNAVTDPGVTIRVARPSDFVDPTGGAELSVPTHRRAPVLQLVEG